MPLLLVNESSDFLESQQDQGLYIHVPYVVHIAGKHMASPQHDNAIMGSIWIETWHGAP